MTSKQKKPRIRISPTKKTGDDKVLKSRYTLCEELERHETGRDSEKNSFSGTENWQSGTEKSLKGTEKWQVGTEK